MSHESNLPPVNRFITTHNPAGEAIFSTTIPEESKMKPLPDKMAFALSYTTQTFPVDMTSETDIKSYNNMLTNEPGLSISNGTVLRHVDFVPGKACPMHRTVSLDYGVVLEGEIVCELDSGESRLMKRGDVCVQRGTMHAWRNPSETEWCRMLFVLQPCVPVEVGGKKLGEELGTAVGIKKSD